MTWSPDKNKRILSFDLKSYKEYPFYDIGPLTGGVHHLIACGSHTVAFYTFGSGVTSTLAIIHTLP